MSTQRKTVAFIAIAIEVALWGLGYIDFDTLLALISLTFELSRLGVEA